MQGVESNQMPPSYKELLRVFKLNAKYFSGGLVCRHAREAMTVLGYFLQQANYRCLGNNQQNLFVK